MGFVMAINPIVGAVLVVRRLYRRQIVGAVFVAHRLYGRSIVGDYNGGDRLMGDLAEICFADRIYGN
jgi:hypothetical protein